MLRLVCKIQSCSEAPVFTWRQHEFGKHITFHQQHQQHWLILLLPFWKDSPFHKKNQVLNVPSLKAMKKLPLTLVGLYRWHLKTIDLLDNFFFFFLQFIYAIKGRNKKYNAKSIHHNIFFLSLVCLSFPWNPEESLVTGTAIHAHTSTNLPGTSLSAQVVRCLHQRFTVRVLFHFPWLKGGSAGQYRLEHQQWVFLGISLGLTDEKEKHSVLKTPVSAPKAEHLWQV